MDDYALGFYRPRYGAERDRPSRPARQVPPAPAPRRVEGHLLALVRVSSGLRWTGPWRAQPAPRADGWAGYCQCGERFLTSRRKADDAPPPEAYVMADHAAHLDRIAAGA